MSQPDISRIRYTPQARPVDTVGVDTSFQRMAAPMQQATNSLQPVMDQLPTPPPKSNNAAMLVEALSGFGKAVQSASEGYEKELIKIEAVSAEYDAQASSAKTWEEAVQQNPALAVKSPFYRKTFLARTAQNAMQQRMTQLHQDYYSSPLVNSTDPLAVNKWLQENLQGDLDKITDPDARAAALQFIRERSATFMKAHRDNATNNLIRKRDESYGAAFGNNTDDYGTLPAAKAYDPGKVFATDLPLEAQALLAGTSAGESGGKYDIRFGGAAGPQRIDTTKPHMNVGSIINFGQHRGKKSTSAGKYQFNYATWIEANDGTNPVMSEENQDRAAWTLAQREYKAKTGGRDLLGDLKTQGMSQGIMRTLGGRWEVFAKGGREDLARYAATYNEVIRRGKGSVPETAAGADPNFDSYIEKQWDAHAALVKGGTKIEQADKLLIQQLSNKVMDTGDPSYFQVLYRNRDGRPALAEMPEYRAHIRSVSNQAAQLKFERQNRERQKEAHEKKARIDKETSTIMVGAMERVQKGEAPHYSLDTIKTASAVDPDWGERLIKQNKLWDEVQTHEDPLAINRVYTEIYSGRSSLERIQQAHLDGLIKNPQTYAKMLAEVQSQQKQDWMGGAIWRQTMDGVNSFFRDNGEDKPEMAAKAQNVRSTLAKAFGEWMGKDPSRSYDFGAQRQFLDRSVAALIPQARQGVFDGESAIVDPYKTPTNGGDGGGTTTPKPQPKPAPGAAPPPPAGNDWRTQKQFSNYGELQQLWSDWQKSNGSPQSELSKRAAALGIKEARDIRALVVAQNKLLIANPTGN